MVLELIHLAVLGLLQLAAQGEALTLAAFVAGAVGYSLWTYLSKRLQKDDPEPFDARKFLRTVIVGVVVGVFAFATGAELNPANWGHLVTASGAGMIADQGVKIIWRAINR